MQGKLVDISVVIPLYNKEEFVARAVTSALNQTVLPKEIIIIDDGSSDKSCEVIEKLILCHGKLITLYKQKNSGVSVARNVGMQLADTKWVAFLDADDEYHEFFIEKAIRLISDFPGNVIYGFGYNRFGKSSYVKDVRGKVDFFKLYCQNFQCPFSASSVILDKDSINFKIFPEGYGMGEDLYAWIKIISLGNALIFDSSIVAIYHHDDCNSAVLQPVAKKEPCFLLKPFRFRFDKDVYYNRFIRYHTSDYIKSHLLYGDRFYVLKYIIRNGFFYWKYMPLIFVPKFILKLAKVKR